LWNRQIVAEIISPDEVLHIAALARLKLTDDEVASFAQELSNILDYINQLREVSVEGVEPTAHAVNIQNVLRHDEARPPLDPEAALANAPERQQSFFKVPKVLDQETA
jgi:aspartyl-tRNA(Asn)/glutamyl-tRNA(Gln) amidotransferase subunit C